MLAEYLGEDEILALVCISFRAACALEEYEQNGEVNCTVGLHGKATERGKSIVGRFLVICLEDMSVHIAEDRISIFYTGSGMDSSEENSIVKWCALVSSKTKESNKVLTLHLEREALLKCSNSELTWRTDGGIRIPSEDEST
ncbi:hypothetical protein Pint_20891 [Pistacia integerrima]|uniref:Uncharacterized protein n=1 Tax=Pistacia integerrima TaxID=434235 RepID=A0ACC0X7N1_9ROSI|nr:hypothetical protein Pint_20891 [Pistacia integerrima]